MALQLIILVVLTVVSADPPKEVTKDTVLVVLPSNSDNSTEEVSNKLDSNGWIPHNTGPGTFPVLFEPASFTTTVHPLWSSRLTKDPLTWEVVTPSTPIVSTQTVEHFTKWEPTRITPLNNTPNRPYSDRFHRENEPEAETATPQETEWDSDDRVPSVQYEKERQEEWMPNTQIEETPEMRKFFDFYPWTPIYQVSSVNYEDATKNGDSGKKENSANNEKPVLPSSTWTYEVTEHNYLPLTEPTSDEKEHLSTDTTSSSSSPNWSTQKNPQDYLTAIQHAEEPTRTNYIRTWTPGPPEIVPQPWINSGQQHQPPYSYTNSWKEELNRVPNEYSTAISHHNPENTRQRVRKVLEPLLTTPLYGLPLPHYPRRPLFSHYAAKPIMTMAPVATLIHEYNKNIALAHYRKLLQHPLHYHHIHNHQPIHHYQPYRYLPAYQIAPIYQDVNAPQNYAKDYYTQLYQQPPVLPHPPPPIYTPPVKVSPVLSNVKKQQYYINVLKKGLKKKRPGSLKEHKEVREGDSVMGYYTLRDLGGAKRVVYYTSNQKDGFKVFVEHKRPFDKEGTDKISPRMFPDDADMLKAKQLTDDVSNSYIIKKVQRFED